MLATLKLAALAVTLISAPPGGDLDNVTRLTPHQRTLAVQPYITRATECVARTVAADPRHSDASKIDDAIVDSMPACATLLRTMINTYDDYFGDGSGEAFFSGPYLDVLPAAVSKWLARSAEALPQHIQEDSRPP